MCQYHPLTSKDVIKLAWRNLCISFIAFGIGYLFTFVIAFNFLKSNTILTSPVFFGTQKIGNLQGDVEDSMKPCFCNSCNCLSISVLCILRTGYSLQCTGVVSTFSLKVILNSKSLFGILPESISCVAMVSLCLSNNSIIYFFKFGFCTRISFKSILSSFLFNGKRPGSKGYSNLFMFKC